MCTSAQLGQLPDIAAQQHNENHRIQKIVLQHAEGCGTPFRIKHSDGAEQHIQHIDPYKRRNVIEHLPLGILLPIFMGGAVSIMLGFFIAFLVFKGALGGGETIWGAMAALCASWIGGSAALSNMARPTSLRAVLPAAPTVCAMAETIKDRPIRKIQSLAVALFLRASVDRGRSCGYDYPHWNYVSSFQAVPLGLLYGFHRIPGEYRRKRFGAHRGIRLQPLLCRHWAFATLPVGRNYFTKAFDIS